MSKPYFVLRCIASLLCFGTLFLSQLSFACPKVHGYPDLNCDGNFVIAFFGDSVTRGKTDPLFDGTSGGVPLRLQEYFTSHATLSNFRSLNFGTSGITCRHLRTRLRSAFRKNTDGVNSADAIVIACGLNEYFSHGTVPETVGYIQSMERMVEDQGIFASVAMVTKPARTDMQPFVAALNKAIFNEAKNIRYDRIDPRTMIGSDLLHPNGRGFKFMYSVFLQYLRSPKFTSIGEAQLNLKDLDGDSVYDSFETSRFSTDPGVSDSDSDGLSDGVEIFKYHTSPVLADTDGDTLSDFDEVTLGSDPLTP